MPLIIRPARLDDAPALTQIMHAAKAGWGYPDDLMKQWCDEWQITPELLEESHCIIAERNGVPIAFSGLSANSGTTVKVSYLYVAPDVQNTGIGKLLLKRTEDHARRSGCTKLVLRSEVNAGGFYEALGYETTGHEPSQIAPGRVMPLMEKSLTDNIHQLSATKLVVSGKPWAFETENSAAIDDHFASALQKNPHLWNGRLLILSGYQFQDGQLNGICCETSFAAFLAWRDWGAPCQAFNIFGCTVLRTSDGCLAYGVMADHTAAAGMIYPPGGNLDPADADVSGRIDVAAAVQRELEEETGLRKGDSRHLKSLVVFDGGRVAIVHVHDIDTDGEVLRQQILAHSSASDERELVDIRLIRSAQDLNDPAIASHARTIGRYLLA